ncbi:uroporphyrinogen III methylase [Legionella lansingensis]|uniref:Uroporphyrinogen-III synthase n=2 Tax=Legionella lansingensis TaxID=45067 RepID=A0A0W0VPX3_9GAMM|nr:uroporphyrinogen-III synthase [Legionella lansingensis]SNV54214.1 uroporphyrinogen III methylase [Legionella lansingensis]
MSHALQGLRILNTRPLPQGKTLSYAIENAGGTAIECPALAIEGVEFLLPVLTHFEQAIFISANAVAYCFSRLLQRDIHWPSTIHHVIAVGQGTANALRQYSVGVTDIPEESNSESLLTLPSLQKIEGKNILLVKGKEGRGLIADTLTQRGAQLSILEVYKRIMPKHDKEYLYSLWQEQAVDIILFTSEQAMQNIFAMFGEPAYRWLCTTPCLVISKRLAKAASLLGMQQIIVSKPEAIIDTLHHFNQGLVHGK